MMNFVLAFFPFLCFVLLPHHPLLLLIFLVPS